MPGPVPKRSSDRRRRNAPVGGEIIEAPAAVVVDIPESDSEWHPVARRWFESLKLSGQRRWYEPSDWAIAYLIAESISRDLNPQFVGVTAGDQSEPIYELDCSMLDRLGDLTEVTRDPHSAELAFQGFHFGSHLCALHSFTSDLLGLKIILFGSSTDKRKGSAFQPPFH